jgi:ArsR family metal-binding transcriptional regulator
MLITTYNLEIFRSKAHIQEDVLHGHAHLDVDITEVLPYLNAELQGHRFIASPPSLTFRWHGKLVTLHPRLIAINALRDEQEAHAILKVLLDEINSVWERRAEITPSTASPPPPPILEVLKQLPRTNCGECGEKTCMVFANLVAQGVKEMEDCPEL